MKSVKFLKTLLVGDKHYATGTYATLLDAVAHRLEKGGDVVYGTPPAKPTPSPSPTPEPSPVPDERPLEIGPVTNHPVSLEDAPTILEAPPKVVSSAPAKPVSTPAKPK